MRIPLYLASIMMMLQATQSLDVMNSVIGRREALLTAASTTASAIVSTTTILPTISVAADNNFINNNNGSNNNRIASRLETNVLTMPQPTQATEFNGVDNLYYPSWLAGEWSVTQTLVDTGTPLGLKYIGGPNGVEEIAKATIAESRKKLYEPVLLRLRYIPTNWGVAEDRVFNTRQRLDAFAGKSVVASVSYNDVGGSNRKSVLAMGGTEDDPLQTTFVRFKGPAAQKTFVVSHGAETLSSTEWTGYELDRAIFALTNQNTAPPLTTDSELIWKFQKIDNDTIKAKLRIAGYLNAQSDKLYFDAKKRAVSLQDYDLEFKRVNSV